MVSYFILVLEFLACLGFGAYALHFLSLTKQLNPLERITWSFALGFGLLGWILFFVGVLWLITDFVLLVILILGASGTIILLPAKLKFQLRPTVLILKLVWKIFLNHYMRFHKIFIK